MARKSDPTLRVDILKQAEHLIHLRGYHCTSLDEIAERCGMTKANLFHHFKSKEDLGLAVLDYKIEAYRGGCLGKISAHADPVGAVKELFYAAACFYRGNGCKAGCFVGNIALEMSDINDRFRERVSAFFEEWVSTLEELLRRHKAAGYFLPGFKPGSAAEAVLALYEGAIMLARSRRDPSVFERVGKEACGMLEAQRSSPAKKNFTKLNVV
jgi:TetR/AcrR family transcriptional regulator, transcriptional repressor for nem operon